MHLTRLPLNYSGNIIKLMLNNVPNNWMGTVLAAITNKSIMFVSRLKMVHKGLSKSYMVNDLF